MTVGRPDQHVKVTTTFSLIVYIHHYLITLEIVLKNVENAYF